MYLDKMFESIIMYEQKIKKNSPGKRLTIFRKTIHVNINKKIKINIFIFRI